MEMRWNAADLSGQLLGTLIDALAGATGELAMVLRHMDPDSLTARGGVGFHCK